MAHSLLHAASVTVVIPAYNEAPNIEQLVEQVLNEPWTERLDLDQIIIIDDCSDDGTQEITERLACTRTQVSVIRHAERAGKNAAMQTGLQACRSDIVIFVDADVQLESCCLARIANLLARDTSLTATSCVIAPLPVRSWRDRAPQFQALFISHLSRLGHGALARVFAVRTAAIRGLTLPDDLPDDFFLMRWLNKQGYRFTVHRGATAYVRTTTGLHDFAKQTWRIWLAQQAVERVLPAGPRCLTLRQRAVVACAAAWAITREPLGFILYVIWRGIITVTPREMWLPVVDYSRYDTSWSTKDLG